MENANPYETPEGDLLNKSDGVGEIKFFSPSLRIGRLRYLSHVFVFYLAFIPGFVLLGLGSMTLGGIAIAIGYIVMLVAIFIAGVQRLHDLNKSGWMILLLLVPLANIILGLYMLFAKGNPEANNYGNPPPPNKTWNKVLGLAMPVLFVLGMVAAIAIPAYVDYTGRATTDYSLDQ